MMFTKLRHWIEDMPTDWWISEEKAEEDTSEPHQQPMVAQEVENRLADASDPLLTPESLKEESAQPNLGTTLHGVIFCYRSSFYPVLTMRDT